MVINVRSPQIETTLSLRRMVIRRSRISVMQKAVQTLRLISPVLHLPFILLS
jgi:hypothetical protein